MKEATSLNEYLICGYEDCLRRLAVLEYRHRLTPLDFGTFSVPEDASERAKALNALVRWRVERLEFFRGIN